MRTIAGIDLHEAQAGRKVARDDASGHLITVGHRDDHALRAHYHVVDGDDEAVSADQRARSAPVGAQADRH